jgi:hypothetical protein
MGVGEAGQRVRQMPEIEDGLRLCVRVDRLRADRWVGEADTPSTQGATRAGV